VVAPAVFSVPGFEVGARIGAGGFGEVYRAHHTLMGRDVAIKILHAKYSTDPAAVARFIAEARAVAKISHPGIVEVHEFGELSDGRHYCVMELVEGSTLREVLRERTRLPLDEALPVLRAIAEAIDGAHAAGIAHRDLKPDNVFVLPDGGVKVIDFGLAKLTGDSSAPVTETGAVFGTPLYMSPEQCRGKALDPRTDLYSFGALAYHVVTGRPPFEGEALELALHHLNDRPEAPSAHADLPGRVDRVVLALLEKDPELRPSPLVGAIDAMAGDVAFRGRRRWPWMLVAGAVVAAGVGAAIAVWPQAGPSSVAAGSRCADGSQRLFGTWDPAKRAALDARFRAAHNSQVDTTIDFIIRDFDIYADDWSRQWDSSCASNERDADPLLYAQRQNCLERVLLDLRGIIASTFDADPVTFSAGWNGTFFIWTVPLKACQRTEELRVMPPAPPASARDEVSRLVTEMHRARADARTQFNAGRKEGAEAALARLDATTRRLDQLGVSIAAQSAALHAWYAMSIAGSDPSRLPQARTSLARSLEIGTKYREDRFVALTYDIAVHLENEHGGSAEKVVELRAKADEALARAGDPRNPLHDTVMADLVKGDYEHAELAIRIQRANPGELVHHWNPSSNNNELVALLQRDGRYAEAVHAVRATIANHSGWFRGDHWLNVEDLETLGTAQFWAGDPKGAQATFDAASAMRERIGGAKVQPSVLTSRLFTAHALQRTDLRDAAARAWIATWVKSGDPWLYLAGFAADQMQFSLAEWAIAQAASGPERDSASVEIAKLRDGRRGTLSELRPVDPAAPAPQQLETLGGNITVLIDARRWADARAAIERASGLFVQIFPGRESPAAFKALLGRVLAELGELGRAIPLLERALYEIARFDHQAEWLVSPTAFALARAISAGDPKRARRLAELARSHDGEYRAEERAAITAWLAAHP
jgi:hypothetical protein